MTPKLHTHVISIYSQASLMVFSASTGVIYTAGILDCETKDSYWLTVYAADRGVTPLSASIEVFIQVPTLLSDLSAHIILNKWLEEVVSKNRKCLKAKINSSNEL